MQMLFPQLVEFADLADLWKKRADQLTEYEPENPTARTLRSNAKELRARITAVEEDDGFVTVAEYAEMHAVSPQSVRAWVRSGELDAHKGPGRGLLIRRNAKRKEDN
jgi:helix-turn-helix protein